MAAPLAIDDAARTAASLAIDDAARLESEDSVACTAQSAAHTAAMELRQVAEMERRGHSGAAESEPCNCRECTATMAQRQTAEMERRDVVKTPNPPSFTTLSTLVALNPSSSSSLSLQVLEGP